jgi:hypothetical protein
MPPAQLIKTLNKCRNPRLRLRVIFSDARQYTDVPHPR